jgi:integrating conjugative element relaxase (TIGR03760 family)
MMDSVWSWLGAATCLGVGGWLYRHSKVSPATSSMPQSNSAHTNGSLKVNDDPTNNDTDLIRSPDGYLPVLSANQLLMQTGCLPIISRIAAKSQVTPENFAQLYRPAIDCYAAYVQLFPASEAHHHSQAGGLLIHTLEVVEYALSARQGKLLPTGVGPEQQYALAHVWTFGVFVAALLHDIAKPLSNLHIQCYGTDHVVREWSALAGTLTAQSATHYRVDFKHMGYETHKKLPMILLPHFFDAAALAYLSKDPTLLPLLNRILEDQLSAEEQKSNVLAQLIRQADQHSTQNNLLTGAKTRFATARAVPLIERLMAALRRMLLEGGTLPLNRSGGAGWVYDGHLWLVCKRVADETRQYLKSHESSQGIPSDNERLYDTWQEYGALRPEPIHNKAIWTVTVYGESYEHTLTMLCFPLNVLYADPAQYPSPMQGQIIPLGADRKPLQGTGTEPAIAQPIAQPIATEPTPPETTTHILSQSSVIEFMPADDTPVDYTPVDYTAFDDTPHTETAPEWLNIPHTIAHTADEPSTVAHATTTAPASSPITEAALSSKGQRDNNQGDKDQRNNNQVHSAKPKPSAAGQSSYPRHNQLQNAKSRLQQLKKPTTTTAETTIETTVAKVAVTETAVPETVFINSTVATTAVQVPAPPMVMPPPQSITQQANVILGRKANAKNLQQPTVPSCDASVSTKSASTEPISSDKKQLAKHKSQHLAQHFMTWLQQQVGQGILPYNTHQSAVHFVAEGMALVSPTIFKHYATQVSPADLGLASDEIKPSGHWENVQRAICDAGVNRQFDKRRNIVRYHVIRNKGAGGHLLSCMVIPQPERWFSPLPAPNPLLTLHPIETTV